jgi:hypothetical protein
MRIGGSEFASGRGATTAAADNSYFGLGAVWLFGDDGRDAPVGKVDVFDWPIWKFKVLAQLRADSPEVRLQQAAISCGEHLKKTISFGETRAGGHGSFPVGARAPQCFSTVRARINACPERYIPEARC